jgi:hypothetical protein
MSESASVDQLLADITRERPQSPARLRLLRHLLENVVLLAEHDPDTLDLKIAEAALSELVEAFETFAPWRDVPKVTIFGSARTKPEHPLYDITRRFATAIAQRGWMGGDRCRTGHYGRWHGGGWSSELLWCEYSPALRAGR